MTNRIYPAALKVALALAGLGLLGVATVASPAWAQSAGSTTAQASPNEAASRAFNLGDYQTARQLWEQQAAANDPEAINNLGILYQKGIGVEQDVEKAQSLYLRAANLGFTNAQVNLGNLYFNSEGVDENLKEAARWYTAAARGGHLRAQYYLAQMYDHGDGVDEDHSTALKWYVSAADGGLPEAKYVVGRMLLTGDGLKQDQAKSLPYLLDAATAGVAQARALLGQAYADGLGTEPNPIQAYIWLSLALDNLPPGQAQQKAFKTLRRVEADMSQDETAAAKRLLARKEARSNQAAQPQ